MTLLPQSVSRLRRWQPIGDAVLRGGGRKSGTNRNPSNKPHGHRCLRRVILRSACLVLICLAPSLASAQDAPVPDIFPPAPQFRSTGFPLVKSIDEAEESADETAESAEEAADDQEGDRTPRSDQPLGQAPPDNSLQFLRGSTVLLQPGDLQTEYGLFYSLLQNRFFEPDGFGGLIEVENINRSFVAPLTTRYGLSEDIQLTGTVPLGVSLVELEDPFVEEQSSLFGVGDIVLGANAVLGKGNDEAPDILGGVNIILPTDNGRAGVGGLQPALGSGFFGIGWNLTAIRSYDPAVFFGSIGHSHLFERRMSGGQVQPGEFIDYSFGMSFAINDEVTLNGEVLGGFQFDTEFNGAEIPNSSNEPISLRLSIIRTVNPTYFIEPSLQFGLTDDAGTVQLGVTFTRSHPYCQGGT